MTRRDTRQGNEPTLALALTLAVAMLAPCASSSAHASDPLAAGVPAIFRETFETPLTANRFLRVAGVDSPLSREIFDAGVATGVWDGSGQRVVTLQEAAALLDTLVLPPAAVPMANDIRAEAKVVLGLHQYTGSFSHDIAGFFDAQLP